MTMSSKYSKNFLNGDIVAVECKVSSNYLHSSGELSLVPMHGSKTAIFVKEDNLTMIRPILEKGQAVTYEGMFYNVVAQDLDLEATWISRNDGEINVVVQSSELTRLIYADIEPLAPGESLQGRSDTADALAPIWLDADAKDRISPTIADAVASGALVAYEVRKEDASDLMAKAATQAGLSAEDLERFTVDVEEAPPPAPEAGQAEIGPHTYEGPGDLCECCGLTYRAGRHNTEAF